MFIRYVPNRLTSVRHRTDAYPCQSVKYGQPNRNQRVRTAAKNARRPLNPGENRRGFKTNARQVADCPTSLVPVTLQADMKRLRPVSGETPFVKLLGGYYMKSALRRILTESARLD